MNFYFTDQIQQSFNKIFHQCNKDIAWEGKAELDALVKQQYTETTYVISFY